MIREVIFEEESTHCSILSSAEQNQPNTLSKNDFPHSGSADTQRVLDEPFFCHSWRCHETRTSCMFCWRGLGFGLFDIRKAMSERPQELKFLILREWKPDLATISMLFGYVLHLRLSHTSSRQDTSYITGNHGPLPMLTASPCPVMLYLLETSVLPPPWMLFCCAVAPG